MTNLKLCPISMVLYPLDRLLFSAGCVTMFFILVRFPVCVCRQAEVGVCVYEQTGRFVYVHKQSVMFVWVCVYTWADKGWCVHRLSGLCMPAWANREVCVCAYAVSGVCAGVDKGLCECVYTWADKGFCVPSLSGLCVRIWMSKRGGLCMCICSLRCVCVCVY